MRKEHGLQDKIMIFWAGIHVCMCLIGIDNYFHMLVLCTQPNCIFLWNTVVLIIVTMRTSDLIGC